MKRSILLVVSVFIFLLCTWAWIASNKSMPYSATDGESMFDSVYVLLEKDWPSRPSKVKVARPLTPIERWYGSSSDLEVCVRTFMYLSKIKPAPISFFMEFAGGKGKSGYTVHSSAFGPKVISNRRDTRQVGPGGGQSSKGFPDQTIDCQPYRDLFKELEANSPLRLNQDFVVIQCDSKVRVYARSSIPPKAKQFMRKVLFDQFGHGVNPEANMFGFALD